MSRRDVPVFVPSVVALGWLSIAAPAQACMNEMLGTSRYDEARSFITAMAAIVAMQMIVRPMLDLTTPRRGMFAGWLVAGATVCVLSMLFSNLSIHLNSTGLAYAFAISIFIPPTYRYLRARRQPPAGDELLDALHAQANEALARAAEAAPSEAEAVAAPAIQPAIAASDVHVTGSEDSGSEVVQRRDHAA